jgi:DNA modification methylase
MESYYQTEDGVLYHGDSQAVLSWLPDNSADSCITSPPYYGLRNYQAPGQIGIEETPEEYIKHLLSVFKEIKRSLKPEGTLWLNLGDTYNSSTPGSRDSERWPKQARNDHVTQKIMVKELKPKDLIGIPWRVAFALQANGWWLRQDIVWAKPNPMPESVKDRCTKAHEYIFLLTKSLDYYFDSEAIQEPADYDGRKDCQFKGSEKYKDSTQTFSARGHQRWRYDNAGNPIRNKRSAWNVPTQKLREAHFAVFPEKLIEPCILAGCPEGGVVIDPFMGSGTTAIVSKKLNRKFIGIDINAEYLRISRKRIDNAHVQLKLGI